MANVTPVDAVRVAATCQDVACLLCYTMNHKKCGRETDMLFNLILFSPIMHILLILPMCVFLISPYHYHRMIPPCILVDPSFLCDEIQYESFLLKLLIHALNSTPCQIISLRDFYLLYLIPRTGSVELFCHDNALRCIDNAHFFLIKFHIIINSF